MIALALGGGVQSVTLLLLSLLEWEHPPDVVIFADTGWERPATYAYLTWLEDYIARWGCTIIRVAAGNLQTDVLTGVAHQRRVVSLPFFLQRPDGKPSGMLLRQCTDQYKIRPIRQYLKALRRRLQHGRHRQPPIDLWLGISYDEVDRIKPSTVQYLQHNYPLVTARMTRQECVHWLSSHDVPIPPKSACVCCPYRSPATRQDIRATEPDTWHELVTFDRMIRRFPHVEDAAFISKWRCPVEDEGDRVGDGELFGNECSGYCGI